jgi:hypothetical protein
MARKRRNQENALASLSRLLAIIIESIILLIIRLIGFFFDLFTFFTSKYKQKSGNGFLKTYFNKGNYGEFIIYRKVIRIFGKESVLTNIYLDSKNTETTEIDVLAVSSKGIYVFEMKNYSGSIYGSEQDQNWTQVLNRWTKNKFYNPLRQNYSHIKALESYLAIPNSAIIPMIVFSNRSRLSKIDISDTHNVFQFKNAIRFIKRYEKKETDLFSDQQIRDYLTQILEKCNMPEEVKQKHINDVLERQKQKNISS